MCASVLCGILLIFGGIVIAIIGFSADVHDWNCSKTMIGWVAGIVLMMGIILITDSHTIKPINVYQGKTTLKYTIVDNVKIDSVVVWKAKKK